MSLVFLLEQFCLGFHGGGPAQPRSVHPTDLATNSPKDPLALPMGTPLAHRKRKKKRANQIGSPAENYSAFREAISMEKVYFTSDSQQS